MVQYNMKDYDLQKDVTAPMLYPVIDVGSNTIRLCMYEYDGFGVKTLFTKKAMAGLANQCSEGKLTQAGVEKLCTTLEKFKDTLKNFDTQPVAVFATASLRNVENSQQVLDIVRHRTGLDVTIISGEEEARLDFIGATHQVHMDSGVLFDIGGGSTEIVLFDHGQLVKAVSIPIGSLNTYAQYVDGFLPNQRQRRKIKKAVLKAIKEAFADVEIAKGQTACGVGGTIRAACKISDHIYDLPVGHQHMSKYQIDEVYEVLSNDINRSIEVILDVVPDRLRTIVTGLTILRTLVRYFAISDVNVSTYGVREGYLYTHLLPESN